MNVSKLTFGGSSISGGSGGSAASFDIERELVESRIALIEEGRERELAELERTFSEKMAQIKGNSAKEIELRSNLEAIKAKKVEEIESKYQSQREKALKEADETAYWLELLYESGIIEQSHFESLYNDLKELIALLTASIKTSKQNQTNKKQ